MQAEAQVPLPFGAMISPCPFALLSEQLKDLRENGCKESLRRKFSSEFKTTAPRTKVKSITKKRKILTRPTRRERS